MDLSYTKIVVANADQVMNIVHLEKIALEKQLQEEGDSLEGSYIQSALKELKVLFPVKYHN